MSGPDRVVAIDWSGRVDAAGQRRHIWAGVWTAASVGKSGRERVALEAGRTREELIDWLIELTRETPRMVVGIDCCFSYPAWFLKEHGCRTVFELWRKVAEGKGEEWLHRDCADDRFWGKGGSRRHGRRPDEFCGAGLMRMMRFTDVDNKITPKLLMEEPERAAAVLGITPKSPFQIGGAGSVGTGSLRAMPLLLKLREAGFRTWPYEAADFGEVGPRPLLVEMYTRLLTGAVKKSNAAARKAYLAERRRADEAFAGISRRVMAKAEGSEDAFDALVCMVEMVRWRAEFPGLKATEDKTLRLEGITWRPGVEGQAGG
ncbi:hypothetical protein HDF16_001583 [Granulicella aggregans]|uniref:DUF429 domain-containing protein n=1 Tax=Granulicella aggregans TaxID=474949 RepID=A0A7W8E2H9_9BACT|nr:DUF429 domain-containing protein [Granulicella aggregans]MBB5056898.1 hypothetical protein [Granulicella aggregans]